MTKLRTPLTFADAMTRVAGVLTWQEVARLTGKSDRCLRKWSDPDEGPRPSITVACQLDVAYRAAGGEGSPFLEAFAHQIDQHLSATLACHNALAADCADVARETGEAIAASLLLVQPGATPRDKHRALLEAQQAETKIRALVRRVSSFLPFGAGPVAGNIGGPHQ